MKKALFLTLTLFGSLYAKGPYTLTNLKCANVYVKNDSQFFEKKDVEDARAILLKAVEEMKLKTAQRDCSTLMLKIESIEAKPNYYIYTKLALGEDIVTRRDEEVESFALSYDASDFFDTEEPHADLLESVRYLVDDFKDHLKDDNE